jgi:hypothetical protein
MEEEEQPKLPAHLGHQLLKHVSAPALAHDFKHLGIGLS